MSDLYKQRILDNYKNPKNSEKLDEPTVEVDEYNASCGDEIELTLKVDDGVIVDVGYEARGCAISIAGASILSEMIKGKKVIEIEKLEGAELLSELGMEETSGRIKCGLLSYEALMKSLTKLSK